MDLGRSSLDPEAFFADNARAQAALAGLGSLCASAGPRVLGVASVAELLLSATAHPGAREAVAAGAPSLAGALVAGITSTCAIGQAPAPAALLLLARLLYPGFGGYLSPASRNGLGAEQLCRLAEGLVQLIQVPCSPSLSPRWGNHCDALCMWRHALPACAGNAEVLLFRDFILFWFLETSPVTEPLRPRTTSPARASNNNHRAHTATRWWCKLLACLHACAGSGRAARSGGTSNHSHISNGSTRP